MPAAKTIKTARKASLPVWDLSHLVPKPAERNIQKALLQASGAAAAFQKKYRGELDALSPEAFGAAIREYEHLMEGLSRVYNYTNLNRATKLNDPEAGKLHQGVLEKYNDITTGLLFFRLGINKLSDKNLAKKLKDKTVRRYKPFLDQVRAFRPYQLSDEVEKVLHERGVTASPAWVRMFDETVAKLRFNVDGKDLTETEVFQQMISHEAKTRKKAAKAVEKTFGDNIQTFGFILNTLIKDKEVNDRQRGFKTPVASMNLENQVEDEVVEALVTAVRDYYPRLSHRYYKLKAKWMGVKKLNYWDRNAPLPFSAKRTLPWDEARMSVLAAYAGFHPRMADIGTKFFRENWIHAQPQPGKDSGAFSASTVPSAHPYILMNYKNDIESVMTLAHELGHGVHQVLAGPQGYLMSDTPLTLAETASVFGEMLTFRSLLSAEKNPANRRAMIAKKVEDMLNTVVRQIAFHEFECAVHEERTTGELTPDRLGEIWMEIMKRSLGPAFTFDKGYKYFWAYISHFYHVPFYVYAYAFADCLVNALYAVYQDSEKGFADKFLALLSAGGTKRYDELLKPFGLDARDPNFWKKGLSVVEGFIDQLESGENAATLRKRKGAAK
jgi:oligoendopeptidase F